MILVDASIWIDHMRSGDKRLVSLLNGLQVLTHPFIVGELACGNLRNRQEVMRLLAGLPQITLATDTEVLFFVEQRNLMGRGIGYIDAHLLAAVSLGSPALLWTRDKRMASVAVELGLG